MELLMFLGIVGGMIFSQVSGEARGKEKCELAHKKAHVEKVKSAKK